MYQLLRCLYAGSGLVDMILVRSKTRHRQVEGRLFKVGVGLMKSMALLCAMSRAS